MSVDLAARHPFPVYPLIADAWPNIGFRL